MKIDFLFKHKKAEKWNKFNDKIKSFILYIKNKNLKFLVFKWILKEKKIIIIYYLFLISIFKNILFIIIYDYSKKTSIFKKM
jgi:hypothetical protein